MPRPTWTTDEQAEWLKERMKNFTDAQASGTTCAFINTTTGAFTTRWPIPAPTPAEIAETEQGTVDAAKAIKRDKQRGVRRSPLTIMHVLTTDTVSSPAN